MRGPLAEDLDSAVVPAPEPHPTLQARTLLLVYTSTVKANRNTSLTSTGLARSTRLSGRQTLIRLGRLTAVDLEGDTDPAIAGLDAAKRSVEAPRNRCPWRFTIAQAYPFFRRGRAPGSKNYHLFTRFVRSISTDDQHDRSRLGWCSKHCTGRPKTNENHWRVSCVSQFSRLRPPQPLQCLPP